MPVAWKWMLIVLGLCLLASMVIGAVKLISL
jgi:hypothetical protein